MNRSLRTILGIFFVFFDFFIFPGPVDIYRNPLLSTPQDFMTTFTKEAKILKDLQHKNIVSFKADGEDPMAIMLEYVQKYTAFEN